jgi:hypothetical protein
MGWQPETQPKGKPPVEKTKGAETLQRLIDADALYMELVKMKDFGELTAKKAIRVVKNAPTIDAVPLSVVRKAAKKLAYIHQQIDLYCDRPDLHDEEYWLEYLMDEEWKDEEID